MELYYPLLFWNIYGKEMLIILSIIGTHVTSRTCLYTIETLTY